MSDSSKSAEPQFAPVGPDDLVTGRGLFVFVLIMALVGGVLALFHDQLGKTGTLAILWSSSVVVLGVQFSLRWRTVRRRRRQAGANVGRAVGGA